MKRRSLVLATPGMLAGAWAQQPAQAQPAQPGQPVTWPDVTLLDGSRWAATQWAGHPAVVVFWSITCPFCKRHNQHLEKLYRAVNKGNNSNTSSGSSGDTLKILAVARERDAAAVQRVARQEGYSFPITLDNGPLSAALSTRRVIPLTVTVDRHGRLLQTLAGEMFEEDVMELLQLSQKTGRS